MGGAGGTHFVDVTIDISKVQGLFTHLTGNQLDYAQERALTAASLLIERYLKSALSEPGTGRTYIKKNGIKHVASIPGKAPAVDTGTLRNSIYVDEVTRNYCVVGPHVEYAAYLEFGTGRMEARPFVRPLLNNQTFRDDVVGTMSDILVDFIEATKGYNPNK